MNSLSLPPFLSYSDPRNVRAGQIISDIGGYYDGQSIVYSATSGLLSVVFHHSHNREGGAGLRLYHTTSADGVARFLAYNRPLLVSEVISTTRFLSGSLVGDEVPRLKLVAASRIR